LRRGGAERITIALTERREVSDMPMGKAAVFVEARHFEMTELPAPPVEPGGILVNITSAGICGSDLHYWRGEMKPIVSGQPRPNGLGRARIRPSPGHS
jgi:threonine dehydrogenase-like Zn-dependent dehydrogenase